MSHRKFLTLVILILLAALLTLGAAPAGKRAEDKFTGVATCDPVGGAPPKVAENGIRYTGQEQTCSAETSDPRLGGATTFTIYGTLRPKANNAGRLWGLVKVVNAGGEWQGLWTGKVDKQGRLFIHSKLVGMDGYYGLQAVSRWQRLSPGEAFTLNGHTYKAVKPIVVLPE